MQRHSLSEITVNFEEMPDTLHPQVVQFVRELRVALSPLGALVTLAVSPDVSPQWLKMYGAVSHRLFLMLYDEHSGCHDAGPLVSQARYVAQAQQMLAAVPREQAIHVHDTRDRQVMVAARPAPGEKERTE